MTEKARQEPGDREHLELVREPGDEPSIAEVAFQYAQNLTLTNLAPDGIALVVDTHDDPSTKDHIVVDLRRLDLDDTDSSLVILHLVRDRPDEVNRSSITPPRASLLETSSTLAAIEAEDAPPSLALSTDTTASQSGLVAASTLEQALKRILDISISFLMIIVLLPVLVVTAILVKTTSPGPSLYRSTRVGKDGVEFTFLKFRTMYADASHKLTDLRSANEQTGPVFKIRNDPRITRVGRFLRRSSIDELPQLLHVLSGTMSLVGPRPAIPDEIAHYEPRMLGRLAVKPGITCIWQVSGRSEIDFDTWIELDLEYIRSWTFAGDIRILMQTIPSVVKGTGAY